MSYFPSSPQPAPPDSEMRFNRTGIVADAESAALIRAQFSNWLVQHLPLGTSKHSDVLLATYEALANAAEHAYLADPGTRGTMDLSAHYDSDSGQLGVTASDHGVWRDRPYEIPSTATSMAARSRGIALMRALADEAAIRPTASGTEVELWWACLNPD